MYHNFSQRKTTMKIQLSLLFLSLLAGKAAAFQSKCPNRARNRRARRNKTSKIGFTAFTPWTPSR